MIHKLLMKLIINAVALWVAASVVPGISYKGVVGLLAMAIIFGIMNTILGIPLKIISFPFIILTFGLFYLIINAFLFKISASMTGSGFQVSGFWPALWGALVTSIVGFVLGKIF